MIRSTDILRSRDDTPIFHSLLFQHPFHSPSPGSPSTDRFLVCLRIILVLVQCGQERLRRVRVRWRRYEFWSIVLELFHIVVTRTGLIAEHGRYRHTILSASHNRRGEGLYVEKKRSISTRTSRFSNDDLEIVSSTLADRRHVRKINATRRLSSSRGRNQIE